MALHGFVHDYICGLPDNRKVRERGGPVFYHGVKKANEVIGSYWEWMDEQREYVDAPEIHPLCEYHGRGFDSSVSWEA